MCIRIDNVHCLENLEYTEVLLITLMSIGGKIIFSQLRLPRRLGDVGATFYTC